jgi:hypothetical protein
MSASWCRNVRVLGKGKVLTAAAHAPPLSHLASPDMAPNIYRDLSLGRHFRGQTGDCVEDEHTTGLHYEYKAAVGAGWGEGGGARSRS